MNIGCGSGHHFIFEAYNAYCDVNWRNREKIMRWDRRNKEVNSRDEKKKRTCMPMYLQEKVVTLDNDTFIHKLIWHPLLGIC